MSSQASWKTSLPETARLRTAHVLFADIVGYSLLATDEQSRAVHQLQSIVRELPGFPESLADEELVCIPTGDGMAIVCFGEPTMPVRFACDLAMRIQKEAAFGLRMGLHNGPVYCSADINDHRNVAGGGINIAQRVMDCGDAGHILLSHSVAETLQQLSQWQGAVHDLGECEVKHGVQLRIFNLFTPEFGNSSLPRRIQQTAGVKEKEANEAVRMEPRPGAKFGPYEIIALIGKGGMGEVWKARDTRLDRIVAIKFCGSEFFGGFLREARAVAALNHANICALYDIGPDYLVMEHIEGAPPRGPLAPQEALRLSLGIAAALEAAHANGIIHRDLKPANILVTQSGIKLLDFGLALVNSNAESGIGDTRAPRSIADAPVGTAAYMSPEQAQGKTADARSDIFAFGVVLHELLSGHRAFSGDSATETMAAIVRDEPAPLRLPDGQDAPPKLCEIVARCLRKSPADRFQTMGEVRRALEQANAARADDAPSIAVLPFANMSADKENEYFSDGLAEEILNLLARIPGLKVIARTSSFAFRGKEQDITKIAETLRVRTILEGSVRRAGNRIRVTAQLIDAGNGSHVWSERYDRDMTDVFAIQDEIGLAISEALKVRLAPRTKARNIEAWQHYLKGQYHVVRFTPESLAKAKECFEQTLAIDPNYAAAYSGLALYYYILAGIGLKPAGDVASLAKSAAEKALAIDPADSDAHSLLATMAAGFDHDWKLAAIHHGKAMAGESVPPLVRCRYAHWYLMPLGRFAEAIEQHRLALDTDPLSMVIHNCIAWSMCFAKQYPQAIEYARRALEIDSNYHLLWQVLGLAQLHAGLTEEAITTFERLVELAPWFHMGAWCLAAACFLAGDRERSQEWVRKLSDSHGGTVGAACYYAATGEVDAMHEALDTAWRQRDPPLALMHNDQLFEPYRTDPRFLSLLQRMNLA